MRYFRSTDAVYERVRADLDQRNGYPNEQTKTATAIGLADTLAHDQTGRVYFALTADFCHAVGLSQMLPELLASGQVEELTADAYAAGTYDAKGIG